MKTNSKKTTPAKQGSPLQQLRRSVLSCMLFEGEFYEDGESIAKRISSLCERVTPEEIAALAIEARTTFGIRHASLLLLKSLIRRGSGRLVSDAIVETIQRADELGELVSLYWSDGRVPLSNPMKRGLARAFGKFSPYELAKYNRRTDGVKLRDVLFLCHAKPADAYQADTWKALIDGTLAPADTWEASLSRGADKKATFERLLVEEKLGYLALLRNLRNMDEAGVDRDLIKTAILARRGASRVEPFRFVAAAKAAPTFERWLDESLAISVSELSQLSGHTAVLVDVSGSMQCSVSRRSELSRADAAAALASLLPCENVRVFAFADRIKEVPARRGLAGVAAITHPSVNVGGGTMLGDAVRRINETVRHDRLIVITDEQSHDDVPQPVASRAYMINVGSYQRGVGYGSRWLHIDGFAETVIRFLCEAGSL